MCKKSKQGCIQPTLAKTLERTQKGTTVKEKKLSAIQRQVLVGCLLGDGNLTGGKTKKARFSLTVLQSHAHKDYVFHLYEIFKEFCTHPPKRYDFLDRRNPGKIYSRWSFSTTRQSCFLFYGKQFYHKEGGKRLPPLIKKLLTPRAIAYWYMDDGAAKWQGKSLGLRFCTDHFGFKECEKLIKVLKERFELGATIQKKGGNPRIYIRHAYYSKIKEMCYSHIIPAMRYKFPEDYRGTKKVA